MTAALPEQTVAATMAGVALATLLALALAPQNAAPAAIFDAIEDLCSGQASTVGEASDGGAFRATAPGVYMPMFKTPPKSGPLYNGPPLGDS